MKVAIVSLSTICEARPGNQLNMPDGSKRPALRFDANYYLGTAEDDAVRRAELYLRRAIATYRRVKAEQLAAKTRVAVLIRDDKVRPLT